MLDIIKAMEKKVNSVIAAFAGNGIILFLLGVVIIITDVAVKWFVGLIVIIIALTFFFGAYKIWALKEEVKKIIP